MNIFLSLTPVQWYAIIFIVIGVIIKVFLKRYWYYYDKPRPSFAKDSANRFLTFLILWISRLLILFGLFLLLIVWYNKN